MKVTELKKGDLFKIGKQRKFRIFLSGTILNGDNIPEQHKGKLLIAFKTDMDSYCKQIVVDPDTEFSTGDCIKCEDRHPF